MAHVVETAAGKTWAPASLSWIPQPGDDDGAGAADDGEAIAGPNGYDDHDDRDDHGRIEAQADAGAEDGLRTAEKGDPAEKETTTPEADAAIPDGEGVFVVTLEGAAALRRSAA